MEGELQLNLRQIIQVLEDILGRPSRWNGNLALEREISYSGMMHYDGSISISELACADLNLRWRTLIHEALHTFSPQYTRREFLMARGWEEGVVEQMQRLLRPQIMAALGVELDEAVLAGVESSHAYNVFITLLEDLRQRLDDAPLSFYRMLLATPLPERLLLLRRSAIMLEEPDKQAFRTALLKAAFVLNRQ